MKDDDMLEEELASFRQQWHEELYDVDDQHHHSIDELNTADVESNPKNIYHDGRNVEREAAELFMKGTRLENEGSVNAAVYYYREAIRLDSDIEFKIAEYQTKNEFLVDEEDDSKTLNEMKEKHQHETESDFTESIIKSFDGMRLSGLCTPEILQKNGHISTLPTELLLLITKWVISKDLDVESLMQFSMVCKWFYACARDEELWKLICIRVWGVNCSPLQRYANSWRSMFFNKPHLQYNGVYISENSYVRIGEQGVNGFYKPFHIVEFYKYLRFFTDGSCLVYTSSDDPQITVQMLNSPPYRDAQVYKGYWRLSAENTVNVFYSRETKPTQIEVQQRRRVNRDYQVDVRKHNFYMKLQLLSTKKKSNNKLAWDSYTCQIKHCATGKIVDNDFDTERFRPFFFSGVRSYCSRSTTHL